MAPSGQTGKSTHIKSLRPDLRINLSDEETFLSLAQNPGELRQRLSLGRPKTVFIDEVQKIPSLLNAVQAILDDEEAPPRFYLTGSSARKLRRGHANLLPGRVIHDQLGPLTSRELQYEVEVEAALTTGLLPGIYTETDPRQRRDILNSYTHTYLKEEIQAEALTRNLEGLLGSSKELLPFPEDF